MKVKKLLESLWSTLYFVCAPLLASMLGNAVPVSHKFDPRLCHGFESQLNRKFLDRAGYVGHILPLLLLQKEAFFNRSVLFSVLIVSQEIPRNPRRSEESSVAFLRFVYLEIRLCCISIYMANVLLLFTGSDRDIFGLQIPRRIPSRFRWESSTYLPKGRTVPGGRICTTESSYPPSGIGAQNAAWLWLNTFPFSLLLRQGIPRIPGDPGNHQLLRSDGSSDSAAHL